eukprot:gene3112-4009_t
MYQRLLQSLNRLNPRAWDFVQLTRMDKPIGIYLLLWPTLWALWIAGEGSPSLSNIVIFVLGVALTRAGGCVINDWADRKVDGHVKRTEQRPLVSGKISSKEALVFFALLMGVSFLLVLLTNATTILLSLGGLALAAPQQGGCQPQDCGEIQQDVVWTGGAIVQFEGAHQLRQFGRLAAHAGGGAGGVCDQLGVSQRGLLHCLQGGAGLFDAGLLLGADGGG